MKKLSILLPILLFIVNIGYSQQAADLFKPGRIRYMGIDYSHVKLIGDFSQFMGAGETTLSSMRTTYFPGWNTLLNEEPDKFNLKSMLRKGDMVYDLDMVTELNSKTPFETMEATSSPNYSKEEIQKFIRNYPTKENTGTAFIFLVESMNKTQNESYIHFVYFRLSDNEILIHERLRAEPVGVGIRNYWAGALYKVIETIKKTSYPKWKTTYNK